MFSIYNLCNLLGASVGVDECSSSSSILPEETLICFCVLTFLMVEYCGIVEKK